MAHCTSYLTRHSVLFGSPFECLIESLNCDAIAIRYLRARDGNVKAAAKMLTASAKWRCDTLAELNKERKEGSVTRLSMARCRFCTAQ